MKEQNKIPLRNEIPKTDKWDLSTLYKSDEEWENALASVHSLAQKLISYKGKLAENSKTMLEALKLLEEIQLIGDLTGNYAFLSSATDQGDSAAQDKLGRFMMTFSSIEAQTSFFVPEIQTIETKELEKRLSSPEYKDFSVYLKKLLHMKPYILSEKEERIFALQTESMESPSKAFEQLTNVDMEFEDVDTKEGKKTLSQSTYSKFMQDSDRLVRKDAFEKLYKGYDAHKNTIAALYAGSVNQDVYMARARGYPSAIEKALYRDNVELSVYENLVKTIHENLAPLHKYYSIMKKALKVDSLRHYDVYTPLVSNIKKTTPYNEAVATIKEALSPLGEEYTKTLSEGLLGGWVDKYENKGKRSGAFSSGGFKGYPYILMNYKEDVLRDVFTLAHEGGHSMHSWYSSNNNPMMQYNYTIFEAEVASTFNEQLVFEHLLKNAKDAKEKTYLINMRIGDILATLYRQTMFAEFEKISHETVESGIPLTTDKCREIYSNLLKQYFGPEMEFEKESDLEGLRIPHFYRAFYVYKYATGISASLALAKRVTEGGVKEKEDYFKFLKSGGSRYPIDALKVAGVDMSSPEPVQAACDTFSKLVDELEKALNA